MVKLCTWLFSSLPCLSFSRDRHNFNRFLFQPVLFMSTTHCLHSLFFCSLRRHNRIGKSYRVLDFDIKLIQEVKPPSFSERFFSSFHVGKRGMVRNR